MKSDNINGFIENERQAGAEWLQKRNRLLQIATKENAKYWCKIKKTFKHREKEIIFYFSK